MQEIFGQGRIILPRSDKAELAAHAGRIGFLELSIEARQRRVSHLNCPFAAIRDQRQEAFGQPRQIPFDDARLARKCVAPMVVDRAEHLIGMVGIYESARPIIDCLAGNGRVVRVEHPMDEAHEHPAGDKLGERRNHRIEEGDCRIVRLSNCG